MSYNFPNYSSSVIDKMAGNLGSFQFYWKIENFSHCLPWMKLKSPSFVVDSWKNTRWCLLLRFRGDLDPISISFELCRENDDVPLIIDVKYELFFLDKHGTPFGKKTSKGLFSAGDIARFSKFLDLSEVLGHKSNDCLSAGTLTACCLMWRLEDDSSEYTRCFGRSKLGLERSSHLWLVDDFSALQPGGKKTLLLNTSSTSMPSMSIALFLDEDGDSVGINIIADDNCENNLCRCQISSVNAEENVAFSKQGTYWFRSGRKDKQVWKFPAFLRKCELAVAADVYLPKDTLKLRFEWQIESGIVYNQIESYYKYLSSEMQSIVINVESVSYDE